MHYLYRLTNQINGKIYIGQTTNISKRWSDHRAAARNNKPKQHIHYALIKYGIDQFNWDIIATCQTQEDANELEILLVAQYQSHISTHNGYNMSVGGSGISGYIFSEQSKQKMSESSKGQIAWNAGLTNCYSQETLQKMAEAKRGGKASEETKQKMAASRTKNRKCSIEGCDNRHDAKGFCSKHYYHFIDKENRPWSDRKHLRKNRSTNKL